MESVLAQSLRVPAAPGGASAKIAMTTATAYWPSVIDADTMCVYVDADCYVQQAASSSGSTVNTTGADLFLPGSNYYRLGALKMGNWLAFATPTGTGNAYATPSA